MSLNIDEMNECRLCPHNCGVNRVNGEYGICRSDSGYRIASVFMHKGEEPVISGSIGICNVFFSGCNLHCLYCQNEQISKCGDTGKVEFDTAYKVEKEIIRYINNGAKSVGFVTPTHYTPHVKNIINRLHKKKLSPVIVYNTSSYEKKEVVKSLEGLVDIYLPDFKYFDSHISQLYSATPGYPEYAKEAIKEMYRQKGSSLTLDDDGMAVSGLIIRHLVLPGHSSDSIRILEWIAENLSTDITISLMSQYYPAGEAMKFPPINRSLASDEYIKVCEAMESLGFDKGWVQELDSSVNYRPDFESDIHFTDEGIN